MRRNNKLRYKRTTSFECHMNPNRYHVHTCCIFFVFFFLSLSAQREQYNTTTVRVKTVILPNGIILFNEIDEKKKKIRFSHLSPWLESYIRRKISVLDKKLSIRGATIK